MSVCIPSPFTFACSPVVCTLPFSIHHSKFYLSWVQFETVVTQCHCFRCLMYEGHDFVPVSAGAGPPDDSDIMDDTNTTLVAEVTDDSCAAESTEIAPLDRASDDYHKPEFIDPAVAVKLEDLYDVKPEPTDEIDHDVQCFTIKVTFACIFTIMLFVIHFYACLHTCYCGNFFLSVCPLSIRLSHSCFVLIRLNVSSKFCRCLIGTSF